MEIAVWIVGETIEEAIEGTAYFSEHEAETVAWDKGLKVFWAVTNLYPDDFARV